MPETPVPENPVPENPVPGSPTTGNQLTVLDPGALCTVQDSGRPGFAHLGVPRSGAADAASYALGNRLVGNDPGAACLETTLSGCAIKVSRGARIAVTGASCEVRVDGRAAAWGTPLSVAAGSVITLGPAVVGLRSYVAVAGGVAIPEVLGSRATDTLSGLGPKPLAAGDVLPIGPGPNAVVPVEIPQPLQADVVVDLDLGPRADWFADPASIDGATYVVGAASNRIGLRLEGPDIEWARHEELPSEPMVLGAVQVPPSGQPIVLLADHATTGGYPVIGVVRDVGPLAQTRPGERVTLRLVR